MDIAMTATDEREPKSLDIDTFYEIIRLFFGPHPVAIWFVDSEAEYGNLLGNANQKFLGQRFFVPSRLTIPYQPDFCGMPVYNWLSSIASEEEKAAAPSFCSGPPGIWIEMSDGKHYRLMDKRKETEE